MSDWEITCGVCGQKQPAEFWLERPSGFKLPDACFQCPECGVAIKRVDHPREVGDGYGRVTLEKIRAWL